ncbi:MAG: [FeFe] hydrogenase H-cluster radical SAM maturase HydG [bacterium]|nr:[FeFe] hydrogenase H-cluster radical SAM maturase HydG [bacterium]
MASEPIDFIDEPRIEAALEEGRRLSDDRSAVAGLISKSLEKQGLSPEEVAVLACVEDEELLAEMADAARRIKEDIYGKRIVIFAPFYVSNYCSNNCLYCAFRVSNDLLERRKLSTMEIIDEVQALEERGHKRLLLVAGEDEGAADIDYVCETLDAIYQTGLGMGEVRRINVNVAPQTVEGFEKLKAVGIGTYQCFQETYHHGTYSRMHPSGPKADYGWRLSATDRAMQAGIDDVSTGVLYGLYDYRFEVVAQQMHAQYLEERFGVGPHAISVPRLKIAHNTPLCDDETLYDNEYLVGERDIRKIIAIIRLAIPYTGLILSTRESADLRDELFNGGVSQVSAGSRTRPGGYFAGYSNDTSDKQFEIEDTRSISEVVVEIARSGNVPSFCTACYRCGRTGEDIMDLLKPGYIKNYCLPNALLTFQEFLTDYANGETREFGETSIAEHLLRIPDAERRRQTGEYIDLIRNTKRRDFYF